MPSGACLTRSRWRDRAGFSVVALSAVLFGLSVVAALATPRWQQSRRISRAAATVEDLRAFAAAFQAYAHEHGDWPPAISAPGAIPAGMETALGATRWTRPAPIGGRYAWLVDTPQRGERIQAAVAVVSAFGDAVSDDPRQIALLQQMAAQAGLQPNRLRLGYRNEPVYVLEH